MTSDEIIALGEYCEELMRNEYFNVLVKQFELQNFQHIMSTEAHETKKREGIYAAFCGLRDFLGHLKACVDQRDKLIAPSQDAQEDI